MYRVTCSTLRSIQLYGVDVLSLIAKECHGYQHYICYTFLHILVLYTFNPLNAELNPICHLLALLGGATIVVVSRLRVKHLYTFIKRQSSPVTGPVWPRGFQEVYAPRFHDIRHMKVVRLSASRTGRHYPLEMFLVLIFTRGWVDPQGHGTVGRNMLPKNSVTPPGFDPDSD